MASWCSKRLSLHPVFSCVRSSNKIPQLNTGFLKNGTGVLWSTVLWFANEKEKEDAPGEDYLPWFDWNSTKWASSVQRIEVYRQGGWCWPKRKMASWCPKRLSLHPVFSCE
jgi:thiol-disulfide isomerase/thioredoxin